MVQLHKILIGIIVVGLISSGLVMFISSGVNTYAPSGYSESDLASFNKMSELNDQMKTFEDESNEVSSKEGVLDILGSYFTNMYQAAKTLKSSNDVLSSMINDGVDKLPLGGFGVILKTGLVSIVMITIFVGIFLAFITKSERT